MTAFLIRLAFWAWLLEKLAAFRLALMIWQYGQRLNRSGKFINVWEFEPGRGLLEVLAAKQAERLES